LGFIWGLFGVYFYRLGFTFIKTYHLISGSVSMLAALRRSSSSVKKSGSNYARFNHLKKPKTLLIKILRLFRFAI